MKIWTGTYQPSEGWNKPLPKFDSEQTMVLVFGAPSYKDDSKPFDDLKAHFSKAKFIGCSTSGEIFQDSILDGYLVVAIVQFEKTRLKLVSHPINEPSQSYEVAKSLSQALQKDDLNAVIVFSEGLHVNGSDLVQGFNDYLGEGITLSGGLAGDGDAFLETWVLEEARPCALCVTALGLYGDSVEMGYGSQGGWDQFGIERTITKSKNNVVYEIDDMPALDLYKDYLGERSKDLPASALLFPLAISKKTDSKHKIVRTILAIDEKEKSLTFAGNVPEGWCAQLMTANMDRLIDGAIAAGQHAHDSKATSGPKLSIAISCVGRRLVLGERAEEEVEGVLSMLPQTQQIGFYSYGEISPLGFSKCDLHNQTMTITTLTEK